MSALGFFQEHRNKTVTIGMIGTIFAVAWALDTVGLVPLDSVLPATKSDLQGLHVEVSKNSSRRLFEDQISLQIELDDLRARAQAEGMTVDRRRRILRLEQDIGAKIGLWCEAQRRIHGNAAPKPCRQELN